MEKIILKLESIFKRKLTEAELAMIEYAFVEGQNVGFNTVKEMLGIKNREVAQTDK